ncbi:hypothetical protein MWU53_07565 [Aliiroseovarius sp. S1123]|uniref:tyrosine-type recombinase/integrase n=1 Tax=unclassified Aliiroseovarius TaxID=2623558 RepID=UPI001FF51D26|nr:tyrosine-type recombinase/integrase [Aliiroseovarius sp. S1123]MCK0170911.1 hypothetical protein [Aliiroseovarius sp. S1123]
MDVEVRVLFWAPFPPCYLDEVKRKQRFSIVLGTTYGTAFVKIEPKHVSFGRTKTVACRHHWVDCILRIALLSGMRSGEVCGLLAEDLANKGNLGSFYRIRSNALRSLKTKTAERDVPVHDVIQHDVLPYLPKEGPLFPGITVDRVTKQFAKMRVKLGLDRPGLVFHSTRKWFITQCERTGVPEHFTASLVGHQSSRSGNKLTYRLYSAGISNSQKRQIIDQIRLPPTVTQ